MLHYGNSTDEEDKTKAYILINLGKGEDLMLPITWKVPPEKVIFPPTPIVRKDKTNATLDDNDFIPFGTERQFTVKGLKGATKDQLKNMLEDAILKVTCGAIGDLLVGVEGKKMLRNAIDRVINELPNGVAATPSWMMEQVASKLADLNPAIKWGKKFVECMKEIIDSFVNALREQVKKDADWLRAQYGGDVYAAKQNAEMDFLDRAGGRYWGNQYGKHVKDMLETNPCNPPPTTQLTKNGNVRAPWDPNEKTTNGLFVAGLEPVDDTTRTIYMILYKDIINPIRYTISFENIKEATDSATNVTIVDTLDSSFDLETIRVDSTLTLFTRGTFEWSLQGNVLTFLFKDIKLSPNISPPEGEWQAVFDVKLKSETPIGTRINNRASITFDFNPPIRTQTVTHLVGVPSLFVSSDSIDFGKQKINEEVFDTVVIRNAGEYPLAIGNITGIDDPSKIIIDECSNKNISPSDSCKLILSFTATKSTPFYDTLRIFSNDLNQFPYEVKLKG